MNSMKLFSVLIAVLCVYVGCIAAQTSQEPGPECPTEEAFLPHWNCSLYWQCANFIPYLRTCGDQLYFSTHTNNCEFPVDVPECSDEGVRPTGGPTMTTTQMTTTMRPSEPPTEDPTTETTRTTTTTQAPTELPSTEPPTDGPTTRTTTTTQRPPTTEGPFECPPDGVHDFPYPGNCSLYYRCIGGTPFVQQCAEDLLFDRIDRICKPAADAVCDDAPEPTTQEPPNPTTSDPPEFECPPTGHDNFPHNSNCSLYYACFQGQLFIESCAFGTYFDSSPSVKQCNLAETAVCHSECPPSGINYLPIRTSRCDHYKVCFEGQAVNLRCADATVYHPVEQRCVHVDSYRCPYADWEDLMRSYNVVL